MQPVVDDADVERQAKAQRRIVQVEHHCPFQRPRRLAHIGLDAEAVLLDDRGQEVRVVARECHDAAGAQHPLHLAERTLALGQLEVVDAVVAEQHEVVGIVGGEIEPAGIADHELVGRQVLVASIDHCPGVVEAQIGLDARREEPRGSTGADAEIEHVHAGKCRAELVEKRLFGELEFPGAAVTRYDLGVFIGAAITITSLAFHLAPPPPRGVNFNSKRRESPPATVRSTMAVPRHRSPGPDIHLAERRAGADKCLFGKLGRTVVVWGNQHW